MNYDRGLEFLIDAPAYSRLSYEVYPVEDYSFDTCNAVFQEAEVESDVPGSSCFPFQIGHIGTLFK